MINPYTGQDPYSSNQSKIAASSNVAPSSFWGGITNAVSSGLNTIGSGFNSLFGSKPAPTSSLPAGSYDIARRNPISESVFNNSNPAPTTPKINPITPTSIPTKQLPALANIPGGNTQAQAGVIQSNAQPTLLQQVASRMANLRGNNPDVQNAYNTVTNLESGLQAGGNAIMNKPIPLEFQQGQEAALQRDYGPQLTAAKDILQSAITGQGQELQGLQGAGTLASPIQVPYSNQVISPLTGEPIQIGSSGLSGQIPNLAKSVLSGSISYDQAVSQLGNIPTLSNQLLQEIQRTNPDFNAAQSNANQAAQGQALTQNVTQGRALSLFANSANAALDKLQTDFANLSELERFGVPGMIGIEQWIGKQFGDKGLATYQTTLNDARSQLAGVLSSSGGATPSGAEDMARIYLPDNMTSDQLASKIAAAKALVQQKVSAFTQTGNVPQYGGTQGNNLYSF